MRATERFNRPESYGKNRTQEEWSAWVAEQDADELARVFWMLDAHGGLEVSDGHIWTGGAAICPAPPILEDPGDASARP